MRKNTRFGKTTFDKTWAEQHGESFDSVDAKRDPPLSVIQRRLDELLEKRAALLKLEGEVFAAEYEAFLNFQSEIIELLEPVLDRLANTGALYLIYDPDAGTAKEHCKLGFESRFGYSIARGYAIVGTRLAEVSAVPPELVLSEDS